MEQKIQCIQRENCKMDRKRVVSTHPNSSKSRDEEHKEKLERKHITSK